MISGSYPLVLIGFLPTNSRNPRELSYPLKAFARLPAGLWCSTYVCFTRLSWVMTLMIELKSVVESFSVMKLRTGVSRTGLIPPWWRWTTIITNASKTDKTLHTMIFDNSTQLWNITTFNEWENSLKMDIFNSYVKFAEGNLQWNSRFSSISYIQLVDLLEPKDVSQTVSWVHWLHKAPKTTWLCLNRTIYHCSRVNWGMHHFQTHQWCQTSIILTIHSLNPPNLSLIFSKLIMLYNIL